MFAIDFKTHKLKNSPGFLHRFLQQSVVSISNYLLSKMLIMNVNNECKRCLNVADIKSVQADLILFRSDFFSQNFLC